MTACTPAGHTATVLLGAARSWPKARLGDVAQELTVGYVGPMADQYVADGVPFLRSLNIEPFRISNTDMMRISPAFHQKLSKSRLTPGDVVIVRTGKPGTASVIPAWLAEANCSDLVIVRPGKRLDPRFLAYYINSAAQGHVDAHTVGAVQQHFNVGSAKEMLVPVPPLSDQQAIASKLGTLDDKIELNRKMSHTLEALARAIFKSWFVDFDPVVAKAAGRKPVGMNAETAALFPDSFQDSAIGPIPKGWGVGTLADVAGVNARSIAPNEAPETIEYIDIASVNVGRIHQVTHVPFAGAPSRARRLVADGDVIWSCVRPNRKSYAYMDKPSSSTVVSTGFAVLTPIRVPPSYLYYWVTTDDFVDYLTANAEGSAYPAVNADRFSMAPMLMPSPAVLSAFEAMVGPMLQKQRQSDAGSRDIEAVRDCLLPALMEGGA